MWSGQNQTDETSSAAPDVMSIPSQETINVPIVVINLTGIFLSGCKDTVLQHPKKGFLSASVLFHSVVVITLEPSSYLKQVAFSNLTHLYKYS